MKLRNRLGITDLHLVRCDQVCHPNLRVAEVVRFASRSIFVTMELDLRHVPFEASNWDVKRAFGEALHGAEFYNASDPKARPM